jgi:hypothetical protein
MLVVGFILVILLSFLLGIAIAGVVDDIRDGNYHSGSIFLIILTIGMLVIACLGTTFEAQQKISTRTPYQIDTLVTTRNGQEPDTLYIYKK